MLIYNFIIRIFHPNPAMLKDLKIDYCKLRCIEDEKDIQSNTML